MLKGASEEIDRVGGKVVCLGISIEDIVALWPPGELEKTDGKFASNHPGFA